MRSQKYIFIDQRPWYKVFFTKFLTSIVVVLTFVLFLAGTLILLAQKEMDKTEISLFGKRPDVIVVFTGDSGRIPYAVDLLTKYNRPHLFITGVYSRNTVNSLLRPYKDQFELEDNYVSIDYQAKNTIENVISTLKFLNKNKNFDKVLVVSHDYHLFRIKYITEHLVEKDSRSFYYQGLKTDIDDFRGLKILFKEVFKFIRAVLIMNLWQPEPPY